MYVQGLSIHAKKKTTTTTRVGKSELWNSRSCIVPLSLSVLKFDQFWGFQHKNGKVLHAYFKLLCPSPPPPKKSDAGATIAYDLSIHFVLQKLENTGANRYENIAHEKYQSRMYVYNTQGEIKFKWGNPVSCTVMHYQAVYMWWSFDTTCHIYYQFIDLKHKQEIWQQILWYPDSSRVD